jgi:hypothetical protein
MTDFTTGIIDWAFMNDPEHVKERRRQIMFGRKPGQVDVLTLAAISERLTKVEAQIAQLQCTHPIGRRSVKVSPTRGVYTEICECGKEFGYVDNGDVVCRRAEIARAVARDQVRQAEEVLAKCGKGKAGK